MFGMHGLRVHIVQLCLCHVIQLYILVCMLTRGSHMLLFLNFKLLLNINSLQAMFSEKQCLLEALNSSQYLSLAF